MHEQTELRHSRQEPVALRWEQTMVLPGVRETVDAASGPRPAVRQPVEDAGARPSVSIREAITRRILATADAVAALLATVAVIGWAGGHALRPTALGLPILMVAINKIAGLYDRDDLVLRRSTLDELPALLQVSSVYTLLVAAVAGTLFELKLGPQQVVVLWVVTAGLVAMARTAGRAIADDVAPVERCLIVGDGEHLARLREKIEQAVGHADVVAGVRLDAPHPLPTAAGMRSLVERFDVHRVILAPLGLHASETVHLVRLAKAAGVRVSILPRLLEAVGSAVEFEQVDGMLMLGVRRFGLTRSERMVKRVFDLLVGGCALVLMLPAFIVIAVLIRLDSPGPVFFRQTRVGRGGVPFLMWKFRSMVADAERYKDALRPQNETDGLFKLTTDPRVTRVGRLLRRRSLDELPQIFNVLRGEMSMVGPRPLVADEDVLIEGILRSRLHLTPGMTGPWQVLGPTRVPLDEMLSIDYLYVANWSLWQDVKLLLRTVPHVVAHRGC
jgi:exopolysaccharide biosynthesis polyprenyl glycosylphosphotransferase